jgi:hypothetical protein
MTRLLTLILITFAFPVLAADERAPPRDMVVLTVSGVIGKTNRGPLDAKRDSLLALQKIDFKEAFAFDRATLLSLPQGTVTVQPREFDKPATFSGPLLHEVLGDLEAAQVRPRLSRSTAIPVGSTPTTSSRRTGSSRSRPTAFRLDWASKAPYGSSTRARQTSSLTKPITRIGCGACSISRSASEPSNGRAE